MSLQVLRFAPGINKESTTYAGEGSWNDADKVRFRAGMPEKIGGWEKYLSDAVTGVPRASRIWRALDGTIYLAIATSSKIYVETGAVFYDVTPIRSTVNTLGASTGPFTTDGSTGLVTITHTSHGASTGDYVTFSGATATGGVTAAALNAEHQVTKVDANSYTITVTVVSSSATTGGGGSVTAVYQLNTSPDDQTTQYGFGSSTWGSEGWDTRRAASSVELNPRTWVLDNWGEDLIINPNGGSLYLWDATNPSTRAVVIANAPTKVNYSIVTKDRHLIAFGANSPASAGSALDTMMVRWCHQEDNTAWTPTVTNTAGGQLLNSGTEILAAADIDQQVLIWTDDSVYSMQYIGPPYTFSLNIVGTNAGVVSPRAWIAYSGVIYWMGDNAFYSYSGGVTTMPCSVQQFVFDALTDSSKRKVFAGLNREFGEIIWFYPTATIEDSALNGALTSTATTISVDTTAGYPTSGEILLELERVSYTSKNDTQFLGCSRGTAGTVAATHSDGVSFSCLSTTEPTEPCRYVVYNIISTTWSIGRMERCTWDDKGALIYPLAADVNGYIYEHEKGTDADSLPLPAYIESSDFDLGEGDRLLFVSRVIPDFTINSGSVDITLKTRKFAQSSQVNEIIGNVTATTENINARARGRQASLRVENSNLNDSWEYGATRIDMRPDGRR